MIYEELKENYTKVSYKESIIDSDEKLMQTILASGQNREMWFISNWRKTVIKLGIISTLLIFGVDTVAFASNGISGWAEELYYGKFIGIAKWIIILKCGWDAVSKLLKEDFGGTKRALISGGLTYVVLTGLPWAFNEIDTIFRG